MYVALNTRVHFLLLPPPLSLSKIEIEGFFAEKKLWISWKISEEALCCKVTDLDWVSYVSSPGFYLQLTFPVLRCWLNRNEVRNIDPRRLTTVIWRELGQCRVDGLMCWSVIEPRPPASEPRFQLLENGSYWDLMLRFWLYSHLAQRMINWDSVHLR